MKEVITPLSFLRPASTRRPKPVEKLVLLLVIDERDVQRGCSPEAAPKPATPRLSTPFARLQRRLRHNGACVRHKATTR